MPAATAPHPPRPRLTVRVGVSGHRWNKLRRSDAPAVEARIGEVLAWIEGLVSEVHRDLAAGYRSAVSGGPEPEAPELRLVSGLAEGGDRLAADAAHRRGWSLQALLPFPRALYERDFRKKLRGPDGLAIEAEPAEPDPISIEQFHRYLATAEKAGGVQELDGPAGEPGAYEPLATALCLNADVVLAIWDGHPGKPGGTSHVVRIATAFGIPVIRVAPDGGTPPWLHDPAGADEGRAAGLAPLTERLRCLLAAPGPAADEETPDLRERYFAESAHSSRSGGLYDRTIDFLTAWPHPRRVKGPDVLPDYEAETRRRWTAEWARVRLCSAVQEALLRTGVHRHYGWASELAAHCAARYRNAFFMNYMLSWMAVGGAAFGVLLTLLGSAAGVRIAALVECLLLFWIWATVILGRRRQYHARWLGYRSLAERIRLLPMLLPVSRTPVLRMAGGAGHDSWVDWMYRAVVREAGLLPLDLAAHLRGARALLLEGVLGGQIEYHERTARRNTAADGVLHRLTVTMFGLAFALALVNLMRELVHFRILPSELADLLILPSLILPALGGALHGLRSQGEFEETAARSRAMQERLESLRGQVRALKELSVDGLGELAVQAATAMDAELGAWFQAYQSKAIPLP
jgi:hypothetical protein